MAPPSDTHCRAERASRPVVKRSSSDNLWAAAALGIVYSSDLNSRAQFDPRASTLPALQRRELPFQRQEKPRIRSPPPDRTDDVRIALLQQEIRDLEKDVAAMARTMTRQRALISAFCEYVGGL
jgi:hypothetical protein